MENAGKETFTGKDIGQLVKCTGPDHFLNCIEATLRAPFFLADFEARKPSEYKSWLKGLAHKEFIELARKGKRYFNLPLLEIDFPEEIQAQVNAITSSASRNGCGIITRTYETGVMLADIVLFRLFPLRHVGDPIETLAFGWLANQRFHPSWDCFPMIRTTAGGSYTHNSTVRGVQFRNYELTRTSKEEALACLESEISQHDGATGLYDIRNWEEEQCRLFCAVEARRKNILTELRKDMLNNPNSAWWKADLLKFQDLAESLPAPNTGYYVLMQIYSELNSQKCRLPYFTPIKVTNRSDEFVNEKTVAEGASTRTAFSAFEIPECTLTLLGRPPAYKLQRSGARHKLCNA